MAGLGGRFGSVLTAMVTPFDADGELDLDAARTVARWLAANGSDGLVVAGTTGEASTLSDIEKLSLWAAVAEAVTIPVIAGTGTNDTRHSAHLTAAASDLGVAGILAVCPYYNRPSQAGLDAHFRAVAAASELPVVIYDIPGRSGRKIASETLIRLARDVPNIVGLKDAAGNPGETARVLVEAPSLECYSGDDALTLALLAVGAVGVIGVATHWTGIEHQEMVALFAKGDVEGARRMNARLLPSFAYETSDESAYAMPTKCLLREIVGLPVGSCRLPVGPEPPDMTDRARRVHDDLIAARRS